MDADVRFENQLLKQSDDLFSRVARLLAEAAILSNRAFLIGFPDTPRLYTSGVRYQNEPMGIPDKLVDIPRILRLGHGDCWHLAAWRVAELRNDGEEKAAIRVVRPKNKPPNVRLFHVLVRRQDGAEEDPSRLLGM